MIKYSYPIETAIMTISIGYFNKMISYVLCHNKKLIATFPHKYYPDLIF